MGVSRFVAFNDSRRAKSNIRAKSLGTYYAFCKTYAIEVLRKGFGLGRG